MINSNNDINCLYAAKNNCSLIQECVSISIPQKDGVILAGILAIFHIVIFGVYLIAVYVYQCRNKQPLLMESYIASQ